MISPSQSFDQRGLVTYLVAKSSQGCQAVVPWSLIARATWRRIIVWQPVRLRDERVSAR